MLRPSSWRWRTTQSMPARMLDSSVLPPWSATFTLTMRAPGATPENPSPEPAMIPAMWVSCP